MAPFRAIHIYTWSRPGLPRGTSGVGYRARAEHEEAATLREDGGRHDTGVFHDHDVPGDSANVQLLPVEHHSPRPVAHSRDPDGTAGGVATDEAATDIDREDRKE